jgi:hypothetical protein
MAELDPATEQQLADLSNEDWAALTARVRPPTSREQFKQVASRVIQDEGQLDNFLSIANHKAFTTDNGDVDEAKLTGHLQSLFGAGEPQQGRQWGQHSGSPPAEKPGAAARAALEKRHGVKNDTDHPGAGARIEHRDPQPAQHSNDDTRKDASD